MARTKDRSIPVPSFARATGDFEIVVLGLKAVRRRRMPRPRKLLSFIGRRREDPNAATRKALRDADAGKNLKHYDSFDDFVRAMMGE
jgi:hypothetical protein